MNEETKLSDFLKDIRRSEVQEAIEQLDSMNERWLLEDEHFNVYRAYKDGSGETKRLSKKRWYHRMKTDNPDLLRAMTWRWAENKKIKGADET